MSKTVVIGSMASAMLLASIAALLTAVEGASKPQTVTLVGAGDIGRCDDRSDRKTARLVGKIPGTVFTLGDHAYPEGTRSQFRDCYAPTWGKYRERTRPTAGNHDYHTAGAKPYFNYFRWRARRSVDVSGNPPKGAGSAQTSPKTEGGARWPTSTTPSMLPVEAKRASR